MLPFSASYCPSLLPQPIAGRNNVTQITGAARGDAYGWCGQVAGRRGLVALFAVGRINQQRGKDRKKWESEKR
jgi:hypothetical protein